MKLKLLTIGILVISVVFNACGHGRASDEKEKKMATIHLTTKEFKEKVYDYDKYPDEWKYEGDRPAVVDFYATWCGPCKALSPVLEELAKEYEGKVHVYKVDVDKEPELARTFGIRSIPTLLFVPVGREPSMAAGAPSKAQLKEKLEGMLKNRQ